MSRMLRDEAQDDPIVQFGARSLRIAGEIYDNTASKFWSGLIDEALEDYPSSDAVSLTTTGSVLLCGDLMSPLDELQREIDRDQHVDLEEAIRLAVEELATFGRPAPVQAVLFAGKETVKTRVLPCECIDAHVFSYLLVWLLHWCEVPEQRWNDEFLSGRLNAGDRDRNLSYKFTMAYRNKHLSEGLYNRSVTVRFCRKKLERIPL